jgi:hypothetical protein
MTTRVWASSAPKGFVHQQHIGIQHIGPRNRHALLHAARQLVREMACILRQVHQVEDIGDPFFTLAPRNIEVAQAHIDIVIDRFPRKKRELLEHHCTVRAGALDLRAIDQDLADVGFSNPATRRRQVVLPQPDGPTMATNSLSRISRLMSCSALKARGLRAERFCHILELDYAHLMRPFSFLSLFQPATALDDALDQAQRAVERKPTSPIATIPAITVVVEIFACPCTIM